MYWTIVNEEMDETQQPEPLHSGRRFVLHRHVDAYGPHLDLRLEQDGFLSGWRIDALDLEGVPWATEKAPHPTHWLDQDGDAVREDAGVYTWLERGPDGGVLLLNGKCGSRRLRLQTESGLTPTTVRAICAALKETGSDADSAASLIVDGVTARQRAIQRFCGLGRELDGNTFDETLWRKALAGLTLKEIQAQSHAYEVRFDAKYPPQAVSQPETLPAIEQEDRADAAMMILEG